MKSVHGARRVVRRNPTRTVGTVTFPTLGNARGEWESQLELDGYIQIAYCRDVVGITTQNTQPLSFEYENHKGGLSTYTPDALITLQDGRESFVEIKPSVFVFEKEEFARLSAIKRHCYGIGRNLDVITDTEIRTATQLENVKLLRTYTDLRKSILAAKYAVELLVKYKPMPIYRLAELSFFRLTEQQIFSLIAYRELSIDWDIPLTIHSIVSLPNTIFRELTYGSFLAKGEANRLVDECALGRGKEDQRIMALEKARRQSISRPSAW